MVCRCSSCRRYRKHDSEELPNQECITTESSANVCVASIIIDYPEDLLEFSMGVELISTPCSYWSSKLNIQLLCLLAHCSHELHPTDKSFFFHPWKCWGNDLNNCRKTNPGRRIGKLQFPQLLAESWMETTTSKSCSSRVQIYVYLTT
jgi:hypothetical protein